MAKIVDKEFCMSSFLAVRYVVDPNKIFKEGIEHTPLNFYPDEKKTPCGSAEDIDAAIAQRMQMIDLSKAALLLSGGIDSGILAAYMPKGAKAYTIHNESKKNDVEVERAARICEENQLRHVVVEVTWDDYDSIMDELSVSDGCPVFGNEPQLYYLTLKAKQDGYETIVFGDDADKVFGGYDQLLSKDWTFDEFTERYTFVPPEKVLKNPYDMKFLYEPYRRDKGINTIEFLNNFIASTSGVAYYNAFRYLGMKWLDPYAHLKMRNPLDLSRIRNGESKYLLRELYKIKYPNIPIPEKIPMARPMDLWMSFWNGPTRGEFLEGCIQDMTGEQKYNIYSLERFLNTIEG